MSSPLNSFFDALRLDTGASTLDIVVDNAAMPAESKTQAKLESSYGEPCKPIRPHRIAAKGIAFLAATLPKDLEPVLRPREEQETEGLHGESNWRHSLANTRAEQQTRAASQRAAVAHAA